MPPTILLFFIFFYNPQTHKNRVTWMEHKEDGAWKRERRLHKRFWCNPLQARILHFQHSYVLCRAICWNCLQQLQPPYQATPGHIIQLRILCMRSARPSLHQHEPPKPTIHNLPYISHAPGQQRHDCRHLDSQARSAQQACTTRQCSARARPRRGQEEEIAEAQCSRAQLHHTFFYLLSLAVMFHPTSIVNIILRPHSFSWRHCKNCNVCPRIFG
jgi:hypothetical protein